MPKTPKAVSKINRQIGQWNRVKPAGDLGDPAAITAWEEEMGVLVCKREQAIARANRKPIAKLPKMESLETMQRLMEVATPKRSEETPEEAEDRLLGELKEVQQRRELAQAEARMKHAVQQFIPDGVGGQIDYAKLAAAIVAAQQNAPALAPVVAMPVVAASDPLWHEEGEVVKSELIFQGDSPVMRILVKLRYPKDKESQVIAMIAANMAPSVDMNDPMGQMYPALQERAVLEQMAEYVMTLRPEKPKTRLEPKYKLYGEKPLVTGS